MIFRAFIASRVNIFRALSPKTNANYMVGYKVRITITNAWIGYYCCRLLETAMSDVGLERTFIGGFGLDSSLVDSDSTRVWWTRTRTRLEFDGLGLGLDSSIFKWTRTRLESQSQMTRTRNTGILIVFFTQPYYFDV